MDLECTGLTRAAKVGYLGLLCSRQHRFQGQVEVEGGRPDWTEVKANRVAQGYAPRGGVRTKLSSLVLAVLDGPLMSNRGGETAADMAKSFLDGDDRVFADVERMRRTAHWRQDRR